MVGPSEGRWISELRNSPEIVSHPPRSQSRPSRNHNPCVPDNQGAPILFCGSTVVTSEQAAADPCFIGDGDSRLVDAAGRRASNPLTCLRLGLTPLGSVWRLLVLLDWALYGSRRTRTDIRCAKRRAARRCGRDGMASGLEATDVCFFRRLSRVGVAR